MNQAPPPERRHDEPTAVVTTSEQEPLSEDRNNGADTRSVVSRYPLWVIVIGVAVFALVLLYLATTLLPGAATDL